MAIVVKMSKQGEDVTKAPDRSLVFNSLYYTLKQEKRKVINFPTSITITGGSFNNTVTFTHNLGYKVAYRVYCEDTAGNFFEIPGRSDDGAGNPTKGIISAITVNAIEATIGWVTPQAGDTTLQVLCVVYIDPEIA